ncbi:hypothetical protein OS493_021621 [Desmophyllum pertusum]|uniref:Ion transport domain-containing protein n=1 Tax=Desmophyllum pertusum TaxID=174260 RepID=A0A9W9YAW8_9CNID|nr:hypothetical protein OS493_021621 [Desmophyllum pertusum]
MNDRAVAIASYLYAFNTLCLTFRAFGHVMEQSKHVGTIQIALFSILSDIRIVFGQFVVAVLAFSFAIAKVYMAEQSYITNGSDAPDTNGSDAHDIVCKNSGISCWWAMFVHLSFSLVGLSEFHAMVTVDVPSETLALLLYAVFLGLGVILLINMLIALLSHTYQKTEDNALQEWAFKRAVTIEAYDDYDPIPVPLNIIYSLGKLLWQSISGRITNDSNTNSNTEPSGIEKSTFDELEKKYFAKHTNFFPLTETGNIRWPGIGVVDKKYNMSYMPGWDNESVGYHTDDGKIYHNDDYDGKETKGPSMARRGDLIRCTVMFERIKIDQNGYTQVPVCFTLNGRKIIQDGDDYFVDYTCSLYPYIGMTDGCSVLAKMCPKENKEYVVSRIAQKKNSWRKKTENLTSW